MQEKFAMQEKHYDFWKFLDEVWRLIFQIIEKESKLPKKSRIPINENFEE